MILSDILLVRNEKRLKDKIDLLDIMDIDTRSCIYCIIGHLNNSDNRHLLDDYATSPITFAIELPSMRWLGLVTYYFIGNYATSTIESSTIS